MADTTVQDAVRTSNRLVRARDVWALAEERWLVGQLRYEQMAFYLMATARNRQRWTPPKWLEIALDPPTTWYSFLGFTLSQLTTYIASTGGVDPATVSIRIAEADFFRREGFAVALSNAFLRQDWPRDFPAEGKSRGHRRNRSNR